MQRDSANGRCVYSAATLPDGISGLATVAAQTATPGFLLLVRSRRAADWDSGARIWARARAERVARSPGRVSWMPAGASACFWRRAGAIRQGVVDLR
jgi:hypothetical protein